MPTLSRLRVYPRLGALALAVVLYALAVEPAPAQIQQDSNLPVPRLLTVSPTGGKVGATVELTFTGTDLDEPGDLLFSHPNIKAEAIKPPPPPPPDPKKPQPKQPAPGITKYKVTIAPDVPVGTYDVRLVSKFGVSNPRAFTVGDLPEVLEVEPNNDVTAPQKVALNVTINGAITAPTDVDYYQFPARKGQRVVVSCLATSIDSRLNPGLEIYSLSGHRLLASNRNYQHDDAVADFIAPEDGEYYVRLYEFTHTRGTAEYFYRLTISTAPWIDAIHPCVVAPGKPTQVTVWGRNLPGGKPDPAYTVNGKPLDKLTTTISPPAADATTAANQLISAGLVVPAAASLDGFEVRLKNDVGLSNPFLLTYAAAPVVLDADGSRTAETAQEITAPCEIAGRIGQKRERDWYVFTAKKGDVLSIEVQSQRLGAPTFMYFIIRNPTTKQDIFESGDNPDTISQKFYGRTDDPPAYRFTAPADGKYVLLVGSRLSDVAAGVRHYYRVRITPEQPDFRLVAMAPGNARPESPTLKPGGKEYLTVFAFRQDGFNGPIELSVEGLPGGVTCPPGQVIGTGMKHLNLVLQASDGAAAWTGEVRIKGTATIKGQKVVREARAGTMVWPLPQIQNLSPALARLARKTYVAVRPDKPPYDVAATLEKPAIVQGDKTNLKVNLKRIWPDFKQPLILQAAQTEVPQGLTVNNNQPITIAPDKAEATLPIVTTAAVQPGSYTIVLRTNSQIPYNKDPMAKQKPNTNVILPSQPVTITVLPKTVAQVTLSNNNVTTKVGTQAEVIVKVARQYDFTGEFKVEAVLPANTKGLTINPVVIPAGKDETKLVLVVPPDAMPGARNGIIIRATAMVGDKVPATQDAPALNVNIVK